ncbi:MAG: B12-binding domain-containing radical SAM protein, partial [Planctomycetota bacterium]
MRILLINPDLADGRGYLSYNDGRFKRLLVNPSMTMPYIASLTPQDHEVIICDEMLGDSIDFDQDVDLVGIT